uniref:hypothetical protein n=1 Tax=Pseudomonas fluorescens TaxID=294 RepID=UPI000A847DD6
MANHSYRRPAPHSELPPVDIPLLHPAIEGDIEKADGGIGVSHTLRPLVVHIDRPDNTPLDTLFELFWGPGNPVAFNLIREGDEQLRRIPFTVPTDDIRESWADPVYVVVSRPSDSPLQTQPLRLRVNLQYPGGQDPGPAPGNQNLVFELPEDVRLGGVDAARAEQGVEVIFRSWLHMAAYDLLIFVWGSVRIERLIQPDEVGRDIIYTLSEADIKEAGDSELLPVGFQVRGNTGNTPDPWAPWSETALVAVYLETDRLTAPWVQVPETDREIDLDLLGSRNVQLGLSIGVADARLYSHVFLYWNGVNAQGGSVSHFEDRVLAGAKGYFFDIDNDLVRAIAQGSATVYYELKGADVDDKRSHNRYLTVIGEVVRWPAPTVDQAEGWTLDPSLALITLRFPAQASWSSADRLQVTLLASATNGTVDYTAGREVGEFLPDEEMTFDVPGTELARFDGRLVEVFYSVSHNNEPPQESLRQVYQVGEPVRDMDKPQVEKAVGGQLDPDEVRDGAKVTAPFAETKKGDWLTLYWYGLVSSPPLRVQVAADAEIVNFHVLYDYIGPNLDEWVSVFYTLERGEQKLRYSNVTELFIGSGLADLPVADLRQASITGPETATLAPLNALEGGTLIISYPGIHDDDFIQPRMVGSAGAGSPTIPGKPGNAAAGWVAFDISKAAIAANIGNANRTFTLDYVVTRGMEDVSSKILTVTVTPIPQAELAKTVIRLNQANAATNVLDIDSFTGNAMAHIGTWPFITNLYPVSLKFLGKTAQGADHPLTLFNINSSYVNQAWVANGSYEYRLLRTYLDGLGDGTQLKMEFKAAFSLSKDEAQAIDFPIVEYTVSKLLAEFPVPRLTQASGTGTSVTLNPLNAQNGGTVSVEYTPMYTTDSIKVMMVGTAGSGSPAIPAKNGVTSGVVTFNIPKTGIAANIGNGNKTFTIKYDVTRDGITVASKVLTVTVTQVTNLPRPLINNVAHNGTLNVLNLPDNTKLTVAAWPLQYSGMKAWLIFHCVGANPNPYYYWNAHLHHSTSGVDITAPVSWLKACRDNSRVSIDFKVAYDPNASEAGAVTFPRTEYVINSPPPFEDITRFDGGQRNGWEGRGFIEVEGGNTYFHTGTDAGHGASGLMKSYRDAIDGIYDIS